MILLKSFMDNLEYDLKGIKLINYYDDSNNRVVKVHNQSTQTKKLNLHFYYPSIFYPYGNWELEIKPTEWFMLSSGLIDPCSFLISYVDGEVTGKIHLLHNKNLKPIKDKVICVGLNKTGTSSLGVNLKKLGFNVWEDGNHSNPINSVEFSNYTFSNKSIGTSIDLIEKTNVDFFQDIPFSCPGISERLIKNFPQARYVLTKRIDSETWVKSVKKFWHHYFKEDKFTPNSFSTIQHHIGVGTIPEISYLLNMFETWDIDSYKGTLDEKLTQVYNNHNLSVKKTLITHNCDWIEIDVSKKGELKKLTNWLEIENNTPDFVWVNKS